MRNIGSVLFLICFGVGCGAETSVGVGQGKDTSELASCGGLVPHPQSCAPGYMCVDRSPTCTRALDCPGVCVEDPGAPTCGGFAGTPCPDGLTCVDDPRDDCDPGNGGADCGGVCSKPSDPPPQGCGGFGNIQCPSGQSCVDDPNDTCDPQHGGADCGGICVKP